MKRLANQLICFYIIGALSDFLVDLSRHQKNGRRAKQRMLLYVLAELVSILIGHNDVANHGIGRRLLELSDGGGHVSAGHDIKILAAKRDLYDFAHRSAVINKINVRFGFRPACKKIDHGSSLSASSRCASSNSRMASSNKSVARR